MSTGHAVSGVLAGGLVLPVVAPMPLPVTAAFIAVCGVFALVPDLDHRSARLGRLIPPLTIGIVWLAKLAFYLTRTEQDVKQTNGHRGLTHTLIFAPVLALLVVPPVLFADARWLPHMLIAAVVGCWAHIAGDCCTEHGCPILWPLVIGGQRWRRLGIPMWFRFKTGKWVEKSIITPLLFVAMWTVLAWQVPGVPNLIGRLGDGLVRVAEKVVG